MATQSKFISVAIICAACIAGLGVALVLRSPATAPLALATGTYLIPSRALPDFNLIDQRGQTFGPASFRGHWSMMFFGYTNCPDFCPTTLTTLAAMERRMQAQNTAVRPQVIFMSVDAKRDTPEQLAKYVPYFDPAFIGVTAADQPTMESLALKLGVPILVHEPVDGTYTVDHLGAIFVLDPDGRITAILSGPFTVEALQNDFELIKKARS